MSLFAVLFFLIFGFKIHFQEVWSEDPQISSKLYLLDQGRCNRNLFSCHLFDFFGERCNWYYGRSWCNRWDVWRIPHRRICSRRFRQGDFDLEYVLFNLLRYICIYYSNYQILTSVLTNALYHNYPIHNQSGESMAKVHAFGIAFIMAILFLAGSTGAATLTVEAVVTKQCT